MLRFVITHTCCAPKVCAWRGVEETRHFAALTVNFLKKPKSAAFTSFAMVRSRKGNTNDDSVRRSSSGSRSVCKLESNETTAQREGAPDA